MNTNAAPGHFWEWFKRNEHDYIDLFGKPTKKECLYLFEELQAHARAYSKWIGVDISPAKDKRGHLIITAYAKPNGFKWAEKLAAKAPPLERWRITALRQPVPVDSIRKRIANGPDAELSKMWFQAGDIVSRGRREIIVFVEYIIPGQERAIGRHVWDVMGDLIGERSLGLDIALYEIDSLCNASKSKHLYPLEELPVYLDDCEHMLGIDAEGRIISHR